MRQSIADMVARLNARDEAVSAELAAFQSQQAVKQQAQLADAHAAGASASAAADVLRDGLLAVHTALSPHSLASVLGGSSRVAPPAFSLDSEGYEALTRVLLGGSDEGVTPADASAVAARVRELLTQVCA
jgi:hypothetical protein